MAVDKTTRGLDGIRVEKVVGEVVKPLWKSRTAIRSRSGDTSTLLHKHGVKLYKALPLGTIGQSLPDQCNEEQICSNKGFDLIVGAIRHHFRPYLEAEPDVQNEVALYQTTRTPKGTFVEFTSRISTNFVRWRVVSKRSFGKDEWIHHQATSQIDT